MSCLVQTGGKELSCSDCGAELSRTDWGREVVLFRLEERSRLIRIGKEELPSSKLMRESLGVFLERLNTRSCVVN